MDQTGFGGMGESSNSRLFDTPPPQGSPELITDIKPENQRRSIGSMALNSVSPAETSGLSKANHEQETSVTTEVSTGEIDSQTPEIDYDKIAEKMPTRMESRSLALDGSTEGKQITLSLTGEVIDKRSERELRNKISDLKKKPYELSNYRDEAMADSLRGSFGRIFGNDNTNEVSEQGGSKTV